MSEERIPRFSFAERTAHWLTAFSFLYAALTGLSLFTPQLFFLSGLFGGGEATRWGHPWGGLVFSLALGKLFIGWARHMRLDDEDRQWLSKVKQYAVHDETGLPEAGRFNAGQKLLFWAQSIAALVLLVTGLVLWFPGELPRSLSTAAILIHPPAAVFSIAGIIVHIYMGTAAVPGAFRGMIHGWVRRDWAASHHPRWYREISRR